MTAQTLLVAVNLADTPEEIQAHIARVLGLLRAPPPLPVAAVGQTGNVPVYRINPALPQRVLAARPMVNTSVVGRAPGKKITRAKALTQGKKAVLRMRIDEEPRIRAAKLARECGVTVNQVYTFRTRNKLVGK